MSRNTTLKARAVIILISLTFAISGVRGQEYQYREKFYIIQLGDKEPTPINLTTEPKEVSKEIPFAIKSNLLYDVLSVVNLAIEVPINDRWSIEGEVLFPWWTMDNQKYDSKRNRLQIINGNIEGRYWWRNDIEQPLLTGWFAGLYAGGGSYDLEYHAQGYQGDSFFVTGATGGYAHTINRAKSLRLEYSLGLGYMTTFYRYYEAEFCDNNHWHAIEKRNGRFNWFGPTKIEVSLSWLINLKLKR